MDVDRVRRTSLRILCVLVFVAFVFDFLFFTGFFASDDSGYLMAARAAAGDATFVAETGSSRMGMTLPAAFLYWVTGGSIAAIAWFHVVYHLVLVVLTFVLGRLVHDDRTGLVAAALVATSPLLYVFAGAVLPDNATACWVFASMIVLVHVQRRVPLGEGLRAFDRRRFLFHVLAGGLLGIGWMTKETALIMTVPAAVLIMSAAPLRNLAWVQNGAALTLGLVIALIADTLLLYILSGQVLLRHEYVTNAHTGAYLVANMKFDGETPFARFAVVKTLFADVFPVSMWLLLGGSIAYAFTRRRNLGVMAYFWWPLLFLTIGTVSLRAWTPLPIQARYYAVAIVPAAVMTAYAITTFITWYQATNRRLHRFAPAIVAVVIGCVGIKELKLNVPLAGNIYYAGEARAFVAALQLAQERYPKQPIVLSRYLWNRMEPLVVRIKNVRPLASAWWTAPPYLYIEQFYKVDDNVLRALEMPTKSAERIHEVAPSEGRIAVVADSVRRLFTVTRRPRLATGEPRQGVVIFAITSRELPLP
jgi:4-amino-4-deoxy-L-arabinose transferase-like glycosyltransferase